MSDLDVNDTGGGGDDGEDAKPADEGSGAQAGSGPDAVDGGDGAAGGDTDGADDGGGNGAQADDSGGGQADADSDPGSGDGSQGDAPSSDAQDAGASDGQTTGIADADPGQPYLFVDLYSGDDGRLVGKRPDWVSLAKTPHYMGAILKAWDGVSFNDGGWFKRHWPAVKDAGGDRYGQSWFRGAYLFLEFLRDGAAQADAYLAAVDDAGGWGSGDILPIVDVEQGGATHPNHGASKAQVTACVTACAARLKDKTGRRVILYGRGAMRDLGIADKMGCDIAWNPAYTATMVTHGLEVFQPEEIALWQYCGDGQAAIASLPHSVPNFGPCDLSVFIKGAQKPTLEMVRDALLG